MSLFFGTGFAKLTFWLVIALLAAILLPLALLYTGRFEDMPRSEPNVGSEGE